MGWAIIGRLLSDSYRERAVLNLTFAFKTLVIIDRCLIDSVATIENSNWIALENIMKS